MQKRSEQINQLHKTSLLMFRPWSEQPIFAALLAIVFYCLYYFMICKLPVIGVPTFRIDYFATTVTDVHINPLKLFVRARPVCDLFGYTQAVLASLLFDGQCKYIIYPLQHITLLIYFFSIATVVESLLKVKFHLFALLGAWFLFAANTGAIEGVYKLESIVGTLSMLFGGVALIFLVQWDRDKKHLSAILFIVLYSLSIFSKEDFILPPLILLGWYLVRNNDWKQQVVRHKVLLITVFSVLFFFLIFNKFIIPQRSYMDPVQIAGHPYFMTLHPMSVAKVMYYYMTGLGRHIQILTGFYLLTTLTALVVIKSRKYDVLLIALIVLSLMAPYSIMPNHVFSYYGLKWWAWQALTSLALVQIIVTKKSTVVTGILSAIILLFVLTMVNRNVNNFFRNCFTVSENIQNSLVMNRDALNAQKQVAVIGIGPGHFIHTPWQRNGETEFYLRDDLRINTQWILFVETGDDNYRINENISPTAIPAHRAVVKTDRVIVKQINDLKNYSNLPRLIFDQDGHGRLIKQMR